MAGGDKPAHLSIIMAGRVEFLYHFLFAGTFHENYNECIDKLCERNKWNIVSLVNSHGNCIW